MNPKLLFPLKAWLRGFLPGHQFHWEEEDYCDETDTDSERVTLIYSLIFFSLHDVIIFALNNINNLFKEKIILEKIQPEVKFLSFQNALDGGPQEEFTAL